MNDKKQKTNASPRQQARIAAVQAIFQQNFNKLTLSQILLDFQDGFLKPNTDEDLFAKLVKAALDRLDETDEIIVANLSEGWSIGRIDSVLRAILRVGIAELMALPEIPVRVVVSEYVDVAHVFLDDKEAGMVNGLLDKVARLIRSGEFS